MTEYISRNEAIKIIGNAHFPEEDWDTENNASYALKLIRDYIPAVDVKQVIHAKWISKPGDLGDWYCSKCDGVLLYEVETYGGGNYYDINTVWSS